MSRPDAFYLAPEAFAPPFELCGGEAAHCAKVLRKRPGDVVRLFDGRGREGLFTITTASRDGITLAPVSLTETPPPPQRLCIAAGFSRSARRDMFLEKAVELGAGGIVFWQAERTQGKMPSALKESWTATLISAAKQCGTAYLPEITLVTGGASGLAAYASASYPRRFLLWEDADHAARIGIEDMTAPGDTLFVLGPEGGLTQDEAATLCAAGFIPKSLGKRVLRWETAAMAVLSLALLTSPDPA